MAKKNYYAVRRGAVPGIYRTWPEAEAQVKGFGGAQFKGFATEAEANEWLAGEDVQEQKKPQKPSTDGQAIEVEEGQIKVFTDGGAIGNPGPGGYGVVIFSSSGNKELSGGYALTTNNRMELMACIVALRQLTGFKQRITLFSDSSYVVNGISKGWAKSWRRRGWLKSDGKPAVNQDLWRELLELTEALDIQFHWVKGHAGNPLNERCDKLAQSSARGANLQTDAGYEKI